MFVAGNSAPDQALQEMVKKYCKYFTVRHILFIAYIGA
jgi:hypothetical protein